MKLSLSTVNLCKSNVLLPLFTHVGWFFTMATSHAEVETEPWNEQAIVNDWFVTDLVYAYTDVQTHNLTHYWLKQIEGTAYRSIPGVYIPFHFLIFILDPNGGSGKLWAIMW